MGAWLKRRGGADGGSVGCVGGGSCCGGCSGGAKRATTSRVPQSAQSLPFAQKSNSDPRPPSSHTSSDGKSHEFTHALTAGGDECRGGDRSCEGVAGDGMLGWGCSGGSDGGDTGADTGDAILGERGGGERGGDRGGGRGGGSGGGCGSKIGGGGSHGGVGFGTTRHGG